MQIVNKILFLALAACGGLYWWRQEQSRAEYDRQVGALATTLDRRLANPLSPSEQTDALFLRSMVILSDFRDLKQKERLDADETTFLTDALQAAGYNNPGEISSITRNLKDNFSVCVQLKIFGDGSGSQSMLTGQSPVIHAGPFTNETLVLVRRLPPQLAPEVVNHPANFALVPAPAADLIWPYTVNDHALRTATDLKAVNVLDAASFEAIKQRSEVLRD